VNPNIPTVTVKAGAIANFASDATRLLALRGTRHRPSTAAVFRIVRIARGETSMGIILPVTLTAAAAAAIINIWLSIRVGQMRAQQKVSIGDDAGGPLTARMRAQLNFVENTAFVLVLVAAIELAAKGGEWLAWVVAAYMLGRVAHGLGMDGGALARGRPLGVIITMLVQLGLAVVAVLITLGVM
tara:strand:+ start:345513 stop:346067 length:555 start_codon:yes stop_codon:yes gene_type:complete